MRVKSLPPPENPQYLFSFDFDDTLYDWNEIVKIPPGFFELIKEWRDLYGILWGINTGRSYDFLKEGYEKIAGAPFAPDFLITMERNIHLADEGLHLRPFTVWNEQCRLDHHRVFIHHKSALDALFNRIGEEFSSVGWWRQEDDEYSIEVENPGDLGKIAHFIACFIEQHPDLSIQRAGPYLRFCHAHYNKGTALRQVTGLFGIREGNVCIFGDGYNDTDTLLANPEALCACPRNAVPALSGLIRDRGGFISDFAASKGVMDSLKVFFAPLLSGRK